MKDFSKNAIQAAVNEFKKEKEPTPKKKPAAPPAEEPEVENPQQAQGSEGDTGSYSFQHPDVPDMSEEDKYNNYNQEEKDNDDEYYQTQYADETQDILEACIDPESGMVRREVLKHFEAGSEEVPPPFAGLRATRLARQSFGVPYLWHMMQDEAHVLSEEVAILA